MTKKNYLVNEPLDAGEIKQQIDAALSINSTITIDNNILSFETDDSVNISDVDNIINGL